MVDKKLRRFLHRSKSAFLISIGFVGIALMVNGFLGVLPQVTGSVLSIVVGFIVFLLAGFLGLEALKGK